MNEPLDAKLREMGGWVTAPQASDRPLTDAITDLSQNIPQMTLIQRYTFYAHLLIVQDRCNSPAAARVGRAVLVSEPESLQALTAITSQAMHGLSQMYQQHPDLLEREIRQIDEHPQELNPAIFRALTQLAIDTGQVGLIGELIPHIDFASLSNLNEAQRTQISAWLNTRERCASLLTLDAAAVRASPEVYQILNQPRNSPELIALFLNPNFVGATRLYLENRTLLQDAAQKGDVHVLRSLKAILAPADLQLLLQQQSQSEPQEAALVIATRNGSLAFLHELITCGATRVPPFSQGMQAIDVVLKNATLDYRAVETLLNILIVEGGVDCNQRSEPDGTTPLIRAVQAENRGAIETLLKMGADPDLTDDSGQTALHHARDGTTFVPLLRYQADCNICNNANKCPLHVAIERKDPLGNPLVAPRILSELLNSTSPWLIQDMFLRLDRRYSEEIFALTGKPLPPGEHSPQVKHIITLILKSDHPELIRGAVHMLGPYIQLFLPTIYKSESWKREIQANPTLMREILKLRDGSGKTILIYELESSKNTSWLEKTPPELLEESLTQLTPGGVSLPLKAILDNAAWTAFLFTRPEYMRVILKWSDGFGNLLSYAAITDNRDWLKAVPPDELIRALKNENGRSPLLRAAEFGQREFFLEAIRLVAKHKPEALLKEIPFIRDSQGRSALHLIVEYSIGIGAGDVSLCKALRTDYPEFFKQLRQQKDVLGFTPIQGALEQRAPADVSRIDVGRLLIEEILFDHPELSALLVEKRKLASANEIAEALRKEAERPDQTVMALLKAALLFNDPLVMPTVCESLRAQVDALMRNPQLLGAALQEEPKLMRWVLRYEYARKLDTLTSVFERLDSNGMKSLTEVLTSPNPVDPVESCLAHMAMEWGAEKFLNAFSPAKLMDLLESRDATGAPLLFKIVNRPDASSILFERLGAFRSNPPPGWDPGRLRQILSLSVNGSTIVHQALISQNGEHFLMALAKFDPQLLNELVIDKDQFALEPSDVANERAVQVILGGKSPLVDLLIRYLHMPSPPPSDEMRRGIATLMRAPPHPDDMAMLLRVVFVMHEPTITEAIVPMVIGHVLTMPDLVESLLTQFPEHTRGLLSQTLGNPESTIVYNPAVLKELLPLKDRYGNTVLHHAALSDNSAILNTVPSEDLIEALCQIDSNGESPLMRAAAAGHSKWCMRALERLRDEVKPSSLDVKRLLSFQSYRPPSRNLVDIAITIGLSDVVTALHELNHDVFVEMLKRPDMDQRLRTLSIDGNVRFKAVSDTLQALHRIDPGLFYHLLSQKDQRGQTLIRRMWTRSDMGMFGANARPLLRTIFNPAIGELIYARQTDFFGQRSLTAESCQAMIAQFRALEPAPSLVEMLEVPLLFGIENSLFFNPLIVAFPSQLNHLLFTEGELIRATREHPEIIKQILGHLGDELDEDNVIPWRKAMAEIQAGNPSLLAEVFQSANGNSIFHGEFTGRQRNLLKVLPAATLRILLEKRDEQGRTPFHESASAVGRLLQALNERIWDANERSMLANILKLKDQNGKTVLHLLLMRRTTSAEELIDLRRFDPVLFRELLHIKDNARETPCRAAINGERFVGLAQLFRVLGYPNEIELATVMQQNHSTRQNRMALPGGGWGEWVTIHSLNQRKIGRYLVDRFNQIRPTPLGLLEIPALLGEHRDEALSWPLLMAGIHPERVAELLSDQRALREAFERYPQEIPRLLQYQNREGRTALHRAAAAGNVQAFTNLARVNPVLLNELLAIPDKQGDTAVHVAAASGHVGILQALREMRGTTTEDTLDYLLVTQGSRQSTPLQQALALGKNDVAVHILIHELPVLNEERHRLAEMLGVESLTISVEGVTDLTALQREQRRLMDAIRELRRELVRRKHEDPNFKPELVLPSDREISRWGLTRAHLQLGFARKVPPANPDINVTTLIDLYNSIPKQLRGRLSPDIDVDGTRRPRSLVTGRIFSSIRSLQANTELRDSYGNPLSTQMKDSIMNVLRHFTTYFQELKTKVDAERDPKQADAKMRDFLAQLDGILILRLGEANYNCLDRMALESRSLYFEHIERDVRGSNQDITRLIQSQLMQFRQGLFETALSHVPNVKDQASTQRFYERQLAEEIGLSSEMSQEQSVYQDIATWGYEQQIRQEVSAAYTPAGVRRQALELYRDPIGEPFNEAAYRQIKTTDLTEWLHKDYVYDPVMHPELMTSATKSKRGGGTETVYLFDPKVFYMRLKDIGVLQSMNALGEDLSAPAEALLSASSSTTGPPEPPKPERKREEKERENKWDEKEDFEPPEPQHDQRFGPGGRGYGGLD